MHFKVFGEIARDQFIQNQGRDVGFRILVANTNDIASFGSSGRETRIDGGGSSYHRWRFGVRKHPLWSERFGHLNRKVPTGQNGDLRGDNAVSSQAGA